jgi:predicted DsbA family dithiol-disulfide isomerase
VNSQDESWEFWKQSPDDAKSLLAFLAAEAARAQGEEQSREFVFSMLVAVHEEKFKVNDPDTIATVSGRIPGLDAERLRTDMQRDDLRDRIAQDYRTAVQQFGAFGTPTFVWPEGDAVFLKMSPPPDEESVSLFDSLRIMSLNQHYIREIKKPHPPKPGE